MSDSIRYFRVRNFEQFQHYKDRRPPWIKLWYSLLSDREFFRLPDCSKWHVVGIFLIASQHENCITWDPEWIQHELSSSHPVDLELIKNARFIEECEEGYREPRADWASRYIPLWLREKILHRDKSCVLCRSTDNLEIDHIIPISKGGKSEESNLQTLCRKCNRVKRFHPMQNIPTQMHRTSCDYGETEAEKESDKETETEKALSTSVLRKQQILSASAIFKHWNSQPKLMHHRQLNGQEKSILACLKHYTAEEIKRAIERYSIVRQNVDGKYREVYQWTLGEFLSRDSHKNLERFNAENWEQPFLNLITQGNKPQESMTEYYERLSRERRDRLESSGAIHR